MQKVNEVLVTTDYDKFKFMEGNRNINLGHLARVKKSLLKKQLEIPVIINENWEIFEGQHRVQACKEEGLPVYFMIVKGLTLEDAIAVNTVSKKWNAEDYFQHYLALGKEQYILLRNFMEITGLSLYNARTFLDFNCAKGRSQNEMFVNGDFHIYDFNRSLTLFEQHMDYVDCPAFTKASFKLALVKVLTNPAYNHSRMKNKLEQLAYRVTNRSSTTDYLQILSEVYNYQTSKDNKVYFYLD